jgi:hypothetical protein
MLGLFSEAAVNVVDVDVILTKGGWIQVAGDKARLCIVDSDWSFYSPGVK